VIAVPKAVTWRLGAPAKKLHGTGHAKRGHFFASCLPCFLDTPPDTVIFFISGSALMLWKLSVRLRSFVTTAADSTIFWVRCSLLLPAATMPASSSGKQQPQSLQMLSPLTGSSSNISPPQFGHLSMVVAFDSNNSDSKCKRESGCTLCPITNTFCFIDQLQPTLHPNHHRHHPNHHHHRDVDVHYHVKLLSCMRYSPAPQAQVGHSKQRPCPHPDHLHRC
jgi:hypothetical protein